MADVFIAAATRTPFGRYGGRLAALRCDDLAAAPITSLMARYPSCGLGRGGRSRPRLRQSGRRRQSQRCAHGHVAVRSAGNSAGSDGESIVRFWSGSSWSGRARDRRWRCRAGDCWGRRKYVARAVRHAES